MSKTADPRLVNEFDIRASQALMAWQKWPRLMTLLYVGLLQLEDLARQAKTPTGDQYTDWWNAVLEVCRKQEMQSCSIMHAVILLAKLEDPFAKYALRECISIRHTGFLFDFRAVKQIAWRMACLGLTAGRPTIQACMQVTKQFGAMPVKIDDQAREAAAELERLRRTGHRFD